MVADSQAVAVVVDEDVAEKLVFEMDAIGCCPALLVVPKERLGGDDFRIEALSNGSAPPPVTATGADLAFLLYTSGSTGTPKAVMVTHENVVSFVDWCSEAFAPTRQDRFAVHSPLHFSLPVFNLYVAWKHGGAVVLLDEHAAKVPELVGSIIEKRAITVWFSTPTILSLLARSGLVGSLDLSRLRLVMFAGEAFPMPSLRSLRQQMPAVRFVHVLGSTETHIIAHYDVPADVPPDVQALPVGPVANRFVSQIVDEDGDAVAPGSDGELCLRGAGVTPGYWRLPAATASALIPGERGDRWYRTGDIVALQGDGQLRYRGRRDRMVKKRGHRIELAEIEACLVTAPLVREVAVVATRDDDLGLKITAFIVAAEAKPSIIALKAHCARALPAYMVPDAIAFCDALPRTATGKLDFPALAERA
jgi:amino acid adenylation domain-containing protein